MTERQNLQNQFLDRAGWGAAKVEFLAGDASNRKYFRLRLGTDSAVLMDAPPEKGEDVRPFVQISSTLRSASFSAPAIIAEDHVAGFLLLEDLGDDLFARVLERDPSQERELYEAATDVLIRLHDADLGSGLAQYDAATMSALSALAFDWYATGVTGQDYSHASATFVRIFTDQLKHLNGLTDVLIQRDYHAENLLWLPERKGVARVGLLDFQDAMAGHRAYDLVSLLQDARRDVPPDIEVQMIERYVTHTGIDRDEFKRAYALMGLQRNLRIIGVFARLCLRDSKLHYIDLIPRVWGHMIEDLKQLNLAEIETILIDGLPQPDENALEALKKKCGTIPNQ